MQNNNKITPLHIPSAIALHIYIEKDADESVLIGVNRIQIILFFAMPLDRVLKVGF